MSEPGDLMSPEASPGAMPGRTGVRRVNNLPMYLFGTVLGLFLIIMAMVASDRAAKQDAPSPDSQVKTGNTLMFAREIAGDAHSGLIEPARPLQPPPPTAEPVPAPMPLLIARPENPDVPPLPPASARLPAPVADEEANRFRMAKLQRLEEAVKARTAVQVQAPRSAASAPSTRPGTRSEMLARLAAVRQEADAQRETDPTAAYQARLAQIRGLESAGQGRGVQQGSVGTSPLLPVSSGGRDGLAAFANASGGDRWKLDSQPEAPRTPYELRAGFVVPATLISGINSDLPGQIMAQVAQNVFDTPTGKHLLIPQGARLVGAYSSDVAFGQARVLVAWQRIVFPDGKAMDIGAMPGADSAGYAGYHDQVNNHYLRLFGSAFLLSGVTAGVTYSQRNNQASSVNGAPTASSALSEALGQQLGQVTAQLIAKNMNIAPTLEIRPGYRFNVIVTRDLSFAKPYRSFDY